MTQPDPLEQTAAAPPALEAPTVKAPAATAPAEPPLRSQYSRSFVDLLTDHQLSVWVTTYQAGKLVVFRPGENGRLDTQSRNFLVPMGLAARNDRFALGTAGVIQEYRNEPAIAGRLTAPQQCDAAYIPRTVHATGDVQIHEMAWEKDELWFVNTRFSCLCNRSVEFNFVPRWKPPFISELLPQDRCHLNGLAMVDGRPRYVTALGTTDTEGGWRENKKNGGVVIDVSTNEIVCKNLSMPHSPRWYDGKLWVLESGRGGLGTIDLTTGVYQNMIDLPGFTRGLEFFGPYAFVGLSQVRETATFGGLAITELPAEGRACGVWVVDTRNSQIVGFLKFQRTIQEIFSVAVIAGQRFPLVINAEPEIAGTTYLLPDDMVW